MRDKIIYIGIGLLLMFIISMVIGKITSDKKPSTGKKMTDNLVNLARTNEAKKLIKTKEFKEVVKTPEFKTIAVDFGTAKLITILTL